MMEFKVAEEDGLRRLPECRGFRRRVGCECGSLIWFRLIELDGNRYWSDKDKGGDSVL